MKIKKHDLLMALDTITPGLADKETIQQSNHFVFSGNRIYTFNERVFVMVPFETGIQGAVPAKEFYDLLKRTKEDNLSIKRQGNEIIIESSEYQAGICLEEEIALPIQDVDEPGEWTELPQDFCEAVDMAKHSASRKSNKIIFSCICVHGNIMDACDNFRLTRYEFDTSVTEESALVPSQSLARIAEYPVKYFCLTENWAHFQTDEGAVFSASLVEANYPDFTDLISQKGTKFSFPSNLSQVLDKVESILDSSNVDSNKAKFTLSNGAILVYGEGPHGWFKYPKSTKDKDPDKVSFFMVPGFLKKMLTRYNQAIITDNSLIFEGDNFIHALALQKE